MVVVELTLPAPPDHVWRHLREPALISRWFGWDYEGLGHEIDVIFLQEARVDDHAHVLEWGDGIQDGDRIALEDLGVETRLRITRAVPAEGYDDIAEGWITFAHQLRFALERGGREARRALHLTAPADAAPGAAALAAELAGAPWYRTEHQAGIVTQDGLLAVWEKPPARSAAMTLTSFGRTPDEAAWRAWWEENVAR
jgi:uncharacterized protein YndB with AHSA1/START domain